MLTTPFWLRVRGVELPESSGTRHSTSQPLPAGHFLRLRKGQPGILIMNIFAFYNSSFLNKLEQKLKGRCHQI
jgi:hypothetical protein